MTQGCVPQHPWKGIGLALFLSVAIWGCLLHADDAPSVGEAPKEAPRNPERRLIIRRYFFRLSDDDPDVREDARRGLMGLSRADLPVLRDIVKENLPLTPAEADALPDIVAQVYLAGSVYECASHIGFLGLTSDTPQNVDPPFDPECGGVEISHRIPGTCSYRSLEDGDVVLAVARSREWVLVTRWTDMSGEIQKCRAGDTVVIRVLRRGRIVDVPIVLDAKPMTSTGGEISIGNFIAQRRADAEAYWEEQFEPLLESAAAAP